KSQVEIVSQAALSAHCVGFLYASEDEVANRAQSPFESYPLNQQPISLDSAGDSRMRSQSISSCRSRGSIGLQSSDTESSGVRVAHTSRVSPRDASRHPAPLSAAIEPRT